MYALNLLMSAMFVHLAFRPKNRQVVRPAHDLKERLA